ncbi:MAG: EAL domain-containing protein [Clostridia bacterium]|nr:EAL domain-containing protein [Clostridia bacterium]
MNTDTIIRGSRKTVLIVEDELVNQQLLGFILKGSYNVLYARNGQEALDILHSGQYRISMILLDIIMPVMDGITFLKRAAEDEQIHSIPIIVLTSDNEMELETFRLGAMDFIKKPYDMPDIILARVRRIIEFVEDREIIKDVEHDPITRLYNRNFFFEYSRRLMDSEKDRTFDMLAIDIDRFRIANEVYGRAFGDQALRALGDGIRRILHDRVGIGCRADADLFYVLIEHGPDLRECLDVVRSCMRDGDHQSLLRIRMGAYREVGTEHPISWYAEAAGSACDSIRGNYQTDIMVYDEELYRRELMHERLIADVDTAIEERQFIVYFQPKYAIQGDRPVLVSAEALIRWIHPELGFISPGDFIPLFEENGLILKVDHYVWQESARQLRSWKDRYGLDLHVSVNVSRKDLFSRELSDELQDIVRENGLNMGDLMLEVTESAYAQDTEQMLRAVKTLRDAEFRIEMDDFGSGYSSLNMLCLMPIDALKIDMKFVRNIATSKTGYRIVELVVEMARALNVPTIVEGVEDGEQYELIKRVGCDIVQGYYFSKPVTAKDFEKLIEKEVDQRKNG